MGYALAKAFFIEKVDVVASPSIWGGGLAPWVAYFLEPSASGSTRHRELLAISTSPPISPASNLTGLIDGKRVLLVDNIMLSGRTMETFSAAVCTRSAARSLVSARCGMAPSSRWAGDRSAVC